MNHLIKTITVGPVELVGMDGTLYMAVRTKLWDGRERMTVVWLTEDLIDALSECELRQHAFKVALCDLTEQLKAEQPEADQPLEVPATGPVALIGEDATAADAIGLIDAWLADRSGYDEQTWPELKRAILGEEK
jgi:hypothetical protein